MLVPVIKRVFVVLLLLVVAWLAFEWIRFPNVKKLASGRPETTAFMELRKKQLRAQGKSDELQWRWVSYEQIAPSLRRAVLVAEDSGFYEHQGVEVQAMREALERNWKRRRITHGGSTITQQLAKNLYLSPSRSPLRKAREYALARSLERNLSKKRILEIYLNVVELGERTYGVEAAARHYFGKSAAAVSPSEAALLAGALPNPRRMNPGAPNARLRARQKMILSRMKRWGHLVETQVLTESPAETPAPEPPPDEPVEAEPEASFEPEEEIGAPEVVPAEPADEPPPPFDETSTAPPTNE
jgi:monofunctional glycosyltransferase